MGHLKLIFRKFLNCQQPTTIFLRTLYQPDFHFIMKAIQIKKFGSPDVLKIESVEVPIVTAAKILVKIKSAGVNPVDTYIREGAFLNLPELPFIPGKDAAGIIQEVGEKVKSFQVGQRVFICKRKVEKYGTYAEYTLVDEDDLFPLDECLTYDQGAALGIPYFTAYRALVLKGKCSAGDTVLIHGASGAVGLASIQIAKNYGLKVIGTAGTPEGMILVKNTGADFVLCHKEKQYLEKIMEITDNKGVNIILEMLANVNLNNDLDILAPRGRLAIIGSRGSIKIDPRKILGAEIEVVGVALLTSTQEEWKQTSKSILDGIHDGWINPVIDRKYPLENAAEAHKDIIHSKGAKGKLILKVGDL